jgi:undecaprenyl-diphosphatase
VIDQLEKWDKSLFLWINEAHNEFADQMMIWVSNKFVWIPLYLLLLFWLFKYYKQYLALAFSLGILILISDQSASGILKPWIERLRPCHDPSIAHLVNTPDGCGGRFGFASSHASNMFAIATFCWLCLRTHLKYCWLLFLWAALIAYSRIYLGVHFPGDVIAGALIGVFSGYLTYTLFNKIKDLKKNRHQSI